MEGLEDPSRPREQACGLAPSGQLGLDLVPFAPPEIFELALRKKEFTLPTMTVPPLPGLIKKMGRRPLDSPRLKGNTFFGVVVGKLHCGMAKVLEKLLVSDYGGVPLERASRWRMSRRRQRSARRGRRSWTVLVP